MGIISLLQKSAPMQRISTREINVKQPNFSIRAIGIIKRYLRKTFYIHYRRHHELISKFNVGLNIILREGLSEPELGLRVDVV